MPPNEKLRDATRKVDLSEMPPTAEQTMRLNPHSPSREANDTLPRTSNPRVAGDGEGGPVISAPEDHSQGVLRPMRSTDAESTRSHIAAIIRDAGLDPAHVSIQGSIHPDTGGKMYRMVYEHGENLRISEALEADPIKMAHDFVAKHAEGIRRNRDSIEGPLV
jgi:hypothetical protein